MRLRSGVLGGGSIVGAMASLMLAAVTSGQPATQAGPSQERPAAAGVPAVRGAVLTCGGFSKDGGDSVQIMADDFARCVPLLVEEKVEVVAIRFRAPTIRFAEALAISDVFHKEFASKFRVVAWIEVSLSNSVFVSHGFEEVYFTSTGEQCAVGNPEGLRVKLESTFRERLKLGELISARGGHDPLVMRAMLLPPDEKECEMLGETITGALSATVGDDGAVRFFNDATTGSIALNPFKGLSTLILDAKRALQIKVSRGTADTLDELNEKLGMKVEWVGEKDPKSTWPVSKAERSLREINRRVTNAQEAFKKALWRIGLDEDALKSASPARAARLRERLGKSLQNLREITDREPRLIEPFFGSRDGRDAFLNEKAKSSGIPADAQSTAEDPSAAPGQSPSGPESAKNKPDAPASK